MIGAVNLTVRVLVSALAVWVTSLLSADVVLRHGGSVLSAVLSALAIGLVLTLVNAILRPVVKFLSLPLYLLTFGLFSLVVNASMLWVVTRLSAGWTNAGLEVRGGFWAYFWAALVLSVVQTVISWFAPKKRRRRAPAPARR